MTAATSLSPSEFLSIASDIDGVDAVAMAMERKWGVGRLRLLAPFDLRARFDLQAAKFNQAVWARDVGAVRRHAEAMVRAWQALDLAATEAGHAPLAPQVWEVAAETGEVFAIVRTPEEAHAVLAEGRAVQVFTLDEIARLLVAFPEIAKAKAVFPGATVEAARQRAEAVALMEDFSDDIPL